MDVRRALHEMERASRTAGFETAEVQRAAAIAEAELVAMISELPPSAVVSRKALAAFKQRHVEVMAIKAAAANDGSRTS
ncbi:hypothetical protein AB1Y20_008717 [Prymnesium parvum]|uniref:DUF2786 domain-containing protein n=1 Tax=Prymnesium parvum TaxID=97485 RepID=A0AB34ISF6_PRYPA